MSVLEKEWVINCFNYCIKLMYKQKLLTWVLFSESTSESFSASASFVIFIRQRLIKPIDEAEVNWCYRVVLPPGIFWIIVVLQRVKNYTPCLVTITATTNKYGHSHHQQLRPPPTAKTTNNTTATKKNYDPRHQQQLRPPSPPKTTKTSTTNSYDHRHHQQLRKPHPPTTKTTTTTKN